MVKKMLALTLALFLSLGMLQGCGNSAEEGGAQATSSPSQSAGSGGDISAELTALYDTVSDTSDLPDWTGSGLKLSVWFGHGTGSANRYSASDDVLTPEIKRLFGIEFDDANSFDNGGQDLSSKLAILAATNDWPALGVHVMNKDLIESGKLYDLSELLPKYAPHYYAMMQKIAPRQAVSGYNNSGKIYSVDFLENTVTNMQLLYPDLDLERYKFVAVPQDRLGINTQLYVRDDILKLAYPEAKTQAEIQELYVKNGTFTREDIYDVPVTSKEEALAFFYRIKEVIDANKITEDGKPVYTTYAFSGQDNWALLSSLNTGINGLPNVNYFTYFNVAEKKMKLLFKESFFKDDLLAYNKFVRDGVASEASLIENNEIFRNKLDNGEYAVSYAWNQPDASKLKAMNKPYQYRKVYFDIPQNTSLALNVKEETDLVGKGISIFKDAVKEEELPRILNFLDLMYTEAGCNLLMWGPRSAGLFEESDGTRKFTNKELEDFMVYGVQNDADTKYNLGAFKAWPALEIGILQGGIRNPKYVYDLTKAVRNPETASTFFQSGLLDQQIYSKENVMKTPNIWSYTNEIDKLKQFWDVRGTGFEPLLTRVLAAKTDAEFDDYYQKVVEFADANGLTDDSVAQIDALLKEKYPEDWAALTAGY